MRQDEHEAPDTLYRSIDLSFAKTALYSCFDTGGPVSGQGSALIDFRKLKAKDHTIRELR